MKAISYCLTVIINLFVLCSSAVLSFSAVLSSSAVISSSAVLSFSAVLSSSAVHCFSAVDCSSAVVCYSAVVCSSAVDCSSAFALASLAKTQTATSSTSLEYALVGGGVDLYGDSLMTRVVTSLPQSYFVVVLEEMEERVKVSYADIVGYVFASGLEAVDYEPVTKFANSFEFWVSNDGYPATLRSTPDHLVDNKLLQIPHGSGGIYYGTALGSSMIAEVGNLWYYVKYNDGSTTVSGYVYKSQVEVEEITPNNIQKVEPLPSDTAPKSPFEFSDSYSLLIILALSLPAAIIMLLIFRPSPAKNSNHPHNSPPPKKSTNRNNNNSPKDSNARYDNSSPNGSNARYDNSSSRGTHGRYDDSSSRGSHGRYDASSSKGSHGRYDSSSFEDESEPYDSYKSFDSDERYESGRKRGFGRSDEEYGSGGKGGRKPPTWFS